MPIPVLFTAIRSRRLFAAAHLRNPLQPIELTIDHVPAGIQIDKNFIPIPIPLPATIGGFHSFARGDSEEVLVRGFLNVSSPAEVKESIDGTPIFADPEISPTTPPRICLGSPAEGTDASVKAKLNVGGLGVKGLDGSGVAVVIVDTGFSLDYLAQRMGRSVLFDESNSEPQLKGNPLPGKSPFLHSHGTMSAFDVLMIAPNATLLDYPVLSTERGKTTVADVTTAYKQLIDNFTSNTTGNISSKYRALVVNNGWAMHHPDLDFPAGHAGRFSDNLSHPLRKYVSILSSYGVDIVFSAGNCGKGCAADSCRGRTTESIMGSSAYSSALTVGGSTVNDRVVGYSSEGPSIKGMYQYKPDLVSYTHFQGSGVDGAKAPDRGTSAACAVASGCIAALRTKLAADVTPTDLFAQFRSDADPVHGLPNGWSPSSGHGIINPLKTAAAFGL